MPIFKYKDFKSCTDAQESNGHSKESSARICGFLEQRYKKLVDEGKITDETMQRIGNADNEPKPVTKELSEPSVDVTQYPDFFTCVNDLVGKGYAREDAARVCVPVLRLKRRGATPSEVPQPDI